jgi:hypothetical protein
MSFEASFIADLKADAAKVKAAIIKVASEAPAVVAKIEADEPKVAALIGLIYPSIDEFEPAANAVLTSVLNLLSSGSAAVEQNLLNAGLDQAAINAAKAILPAAKQLQAAKK